MKRILTKTISGLDEDQFRRRSFLDEENSNEDYFDEDNFVAENF